MLSFWTSCVNTSDKIRKKVLHEVNSVCFGASESRSQLSSMMWNQNYFESNWQNYTSFDAAPWVIIRLEHTLDRWERRERKLLKNILAVEGLGTFLWRRSAKNIKGA